MSFHSQQSLSIGFIHVSLGLHAPPPCPQSAYHKCHAVLIAPLERSTCPNQRSILSLKMRSRSSSSSFASNSLDRTVATSSGLIPQICLIIIALQVCLGQWPSFTGMEHGAPHARAVYMATRLVREVAGCENW